MPLTGADMRRLESAGHDMNRVAVLDDEWVPQLRMVDGHCVFLDPLKGCTVHAVRPEGCRLYPLVWDRDVGRVVRDDVICPFRNEFPDDPEGERRVRETMATLSQEANVRRAQNPGVDPTNLAAWR
jgi:Fe-S-cluster containining protein